MATRLTQSEIDEALTEVPEWTQADDAIEREFEFDDFLAAIEFINAIAPLAEDADHHPEIFNVYNRVELTLTTHDADGLTQKDFALAAMIDQVI